MILIFADEFYLNRYGEIIENLNYFGFNYLIINASNPIELFFYDNQINDIRINSISISSIKAVWYREGKISFSGDNIIYSDKVTDCLEKSSKGVIKEVNTFLNYENHSLIEFLIELLNGKKSLGTYYEVNKLVVLNKAKEAGLIVPFTFISNRLDTVLKKLSVSTGDFITKPITNFPKILFNQEHFLFVQKVSGNLKEYPEQFYPSLFQKCIDVEYDLRIIYVDGKIFSSIFYTEAKTTIDIRCDYGRGNVELIRYQLPLDIELKLDKLMKSLNLNFGAIDMIRDKQGDYYFLEVNPHGQFDDVAFMCKYPIYRIIFDFLTN